MPVACFGGRGPLSISRMEIKGMVVSDQKRKAKNGNWLVTCDFSWAAYQRSTNKKAEPYEALP